MRLIFRFLALILFANFASAAPAMTLVIDPNTLVLNGATGVELNGSFYDVEFVDGTCVALFSGCDSTSDFDFQSEVDAVAAAQVLINQVLLGTVPQVDGCVPAICTVLIPYGSPVDNLTVVEAFSEQGVGLNFATTTTGPLVDTGGADTLHTWVRFTPSEAAALPEPGTWAMMLLGFGAVGFVLRRMKKTVPATA